MCFTFNKNNKQTKKPVNRFLQDDASAGIRSLQTSIEIKLCQNRWNGLQVVDDYVKDGGPGGSVLRVTFIVIFAHLNQRQI